MHIVNRAVLPEAYHCRGVYACNNSCLFLGGGRFYGHQAEHVLPFGQFSEGKGEVVINLLGVVVGRPEIFKNSFSVLSLDNAANEGAHIGILDLLDEMKLHFLSKDNGKVIRLSIGLDLEKLGLPVSDCSVGKGVVGSVVDLADGKNIVESPDKSIPVHVEDSIVGVFVELEQHPLFLLVFHIIPNRVLVVPHQFGLFVTPGVSDLHQLHHLSCLQLRLIHPQLN